MNRNKFFKSFTDIVTSAVTACEEEFFDNLREGQVLLITQTRIYLYADVHQFEVDTTNNEQYLSCIIDLLIRAKEPSIVIAICGIRNEPMYEAMKYLGEGRDWMMDVRNSVVPIEVSGMMKLVRLVNSMK